MARCDGFPLPKGWPKRIHVNNIWTPVQGGGANPSLRYFFSGMWAVLGLIC